MTSFSCTQKKDNSKVSKITNEKKIIQNKFDTFTSENMVETKECTVFGKKIDKDDSKYDFGTKEEFFYGVFIEDRNVRLSSYYIGKYEVTWQLWQKVRQWAIENGYVIGEGQCGSNLASDEKEQPVTCVSWYDCIVWCNAFTYMLQDSEENCVYLVDGSPFKDAKDSTLYEKIIFDITKKGFRLPTEAEWELSARLCKEKTETTSNYGTEAEPLYLLNLNCLSGAKAPYQYSEECKKVAWYQKNADERTRKVALLACNDQGVFDMAGNVAEWCWDWHGNIKAETIANPLGAEKGKYKISRGGYIRAAGLYCMCGYRCFLGQTPTFAYEDLGFRLARFK